MAVLRPLTSRANPVLWGVAAALLNFVPYVGAIGGILMVGMVALISFDSIGYAAIPPLLYVAFSLIEGQFVTPVFLGRRLELNAVAIFTLCSLMGLALGNRGRNYCRAAACYHEGVLRPFREFEFLRRVSLRAAVDDTC